MTQIGGYTGITYPLHYSTIERDVKKLIEYVETINDPDVDGNIKQEAVSRAAFRTIKIDNELARINTFLDFFPKPRP